MLAAPALCAQDHVGQPVPKYVTGDECLFCHRVEVADTWEQNPHSRTIHLRDADDPATKDIPEEVIYVLGDRPPFRGLKEDGYGKFDLLEPNGKSWDKDAFAQRCASCRPRW